MNRVSIPRDIGESGQKVDAFYGAVRQRILSCELPPGSTLTEPALTEAYGIGRSTCRLALARLAQDGLVRSLPRQGYAVSDVTLRDVEEVFAMRLLLEPAAAREAAGRVDVRALARLDAAQRSNRASRNAGNRVSHFLDANRQFHLAIAAASGNGRLAAGISTLLDEMKRFVALGFVETGGDPTVADDHVELMATLGRGDGAGAERVARRHVETFRAMTLDRVHESLRRLQSAAPLGRRAEGGA